MASGAQQKGGEVMAGVGQSGGTGLRGVPKWAQRFRTGEPTAWDPQARPKRRGHWPTSQICWAKSSNWASPTLCRGR